MSKSVRHQKKHKKSPENLCFQGFFGGENRICKERSNGIVKATCCLSVTPFHCPVLTAENTSECHGRNEKGKHNCVSLFRCDLNTSLVCMADSMRPQLNTFYLAMKTYRIRLPTNRMLNSHPIFYAFRGVVVPQ